MRVWLNRWTGVGHLGRDPEQIETHGKASLCVISLALHPPKSSRTLWLKVHVWGKTAEAAVKHLRRGDLIHVTGELRVKTWEPAPGKKRTAVEIHAVPGGIMYLNLQPKDGEERAREEETYGDDDPEDNG